MEGGMGLQLIICQIEFYDMLNWINQTVLSNSEHCSSAKEDNADIVVAGTSAGYSGKIKETLIEPSVAARMIVSAAEGENLHNLVLRKQL
ncbi:hypothetical protein SUGI_0100780 [Cryptomeria japonica]|nr:hypothetical protein SUGI_0100780 [Cryptomeria japonica]